MGGSGNFLKFIYSSTLILYILGTCQYHPEQPDVLAEMHVVVLIKIKIMQVFCEFPTEVLCGTSNWSLIMQLDSDMWAGSR